MLVTTVWAHDTAVLIDPVGPTLGVIATAMRFPTVDVGVRLHHMHRPDFGLTVKLDFTTTVPAFFRITHAGVRVGARYALRERGLHDYALSPFMLLGLTSTSLRGTGALTHYGTTGLGLDIHRTWVWRHLVFQLGVGAYTRVAFAYTPLYTTFDNAAPSRFRVLPALDGSVGYAF